MRSCGSRRPFRSLRSSIIQFAASERIASRKMMRFLIPTRARAAIGTSLLLFSSFFFLSAVHASRGNGSVVEDAAYSPCRVPPAVAFVASRTSTASRSLGSCLAVRPSGKIRQTRLNVPVISRPRVAKVAMRKINVGRRSRRRMGYAATRRRRRDGTVAAAIGPFRTAFEKLSPRPSVQSGLSGPRGLLPSPCLCRWDERETRGALCLTASARS